MLGRVPSSDLEQLRYSQVVLAVTEDGRTEVRMHLLEADFGHIMWEDGSGECYALQVDPGRRRQGLGTRLWRAADAVHPIRHSAWRTDDGDALARSIGGELPPRRRA